MNDSSLTSAIPDYVKRYLWDTDISRIDIRKKPLWLVARILDKGNIQAIDWLRKTFSDDDIRKTLTVSRDLSLRSASFWAHRYDVPLSEVKCFQEPYRAQRKQLWPY